MSAVVIRDEEFSSAVRLQFDALLDELGFFWAGSGGGCVRYEAADMDIEVCHEARDHFIRTVILAHIQNFSSRLDLDRVYLAAGLGSAQHMGTSAQTRRAMTKSLATQAGALRQVILVLRSSDAAQIIAKAEQS